MLGSWGFRGGAAEVLREARGAKGDRKGQGPLGGDRWEDRPARGNKSTSNQGPKLARLKFMCLQIIWGHFEEGCGVGTAVFGILPRHPEAGVPHPF